MTDRIDELEQVRRAADELVPQLTERLAAHGLGEIEVRSGDLRVRVAAAAVGTASADASAAALGTPSAPPHPTPGSVPAPAAGSHGVLSPAVGYFIFGDGLGAGLAVEKGDPLGFVEVLGVHHEVRAPRRGTVRSLVTETGEAVEYGQTLIELEASEA
jgi:biotin carboxyl carrier protein